MNNFKEALAKLDAAKKLYRETNSQSTWYKCSEEVLAVAHVVIEAASNFKEAKVAFKKSPASSNAKLAAYLKLMDFCSTIELLYATSKRYGHLLGRYLDIEDGEREYYPYEQKWEKLSLEAVGAQGSPVELAALYVDGKIFGKAIEVAKNRIEKAYANCESFEELHKLHGSFGSLTGEFNNSPLKWMYAHAFDRLCEELS